MSSTTPLTLKSASSSLNGRVDYEVALEPTIAGITAALLTLFDLDRVFYVPARVQRKVVLYLWWWGFILVNAPIQRR